MKKILLALAFVLVLTGCSPLSTVTDDGLPSHFWGYTTWKFNRGPGLSFDGEHTARIDVEFTEMTPGKYALAGTIHYNNPVMSCSWAPGGDLCPVYDCSVASVRDGTLTGTAYEEDDGMLTMWLEYASKDDRPEEMVTTACKDGTVPATTTPWSTLAQTLQADGGLVQNVWDLDVTDITFIDEIPTDATESSDAKTAYHQFNTVVEGSGDTGSGLFALYKNQPR